MKKNFRYNARTACFCGEGCIADNAKLFSDCGKRAAVITSRFAEGCRNYALEDIQDVLASRGIEVLVLDGVEEDQPVESVVRLAERCAEFGAEIIVAIGGGSAIDSAKAAALLLKHTGEEPYEVFYSMGAPSDSIKSEADIPVFAVPTTAGTGAEVTGFAVLTRADTDTKLSMYPVVFCEAAFLDPRYIRSSPDFLLCSGAMDALAHGVETYLHLGSSLLNRSIAEIGFSLFAGYKDRLIDGTLHGDDFQNMQIVSFVMGMAFMQSSTTIPHGMGYPLSHYKRVNHGLACAAFLGEYLKRMDDQSLVSPIVRACGFADTAEFAAYTDRMVRKHVKLSVNMQELQKWTDDFMKLDFRLASDPGHWRREDILDIYTEALRPYLEK